MKKILFSLLAIVICSCITTVKSQETTNKPPNILLIITDDLGYHDLSFTGSQIYETPNIDALANNSLTFTNGYSSYPRCTPSRYAMMTGTYPVNEDHGHLAAIPADKNFFQILRKDGYHSSYVGKWHLGGTENAPKGVGFDHSFAAGETGGVPSRFYPFNTEKAKQKGDKDKLLDEEVEKVGKKGDYISDLLTDQTMNFIKDNGTDKPFFAVLAYYAVHTPLEAKPEDKARNKQQIDAFDYGDTPEYIQEGAGRRKMRQDDADYAGMVENVDENVGRLLALLKEMKIDKNTIIVFTSDHGGLSNDGDKRERHLATTNFPLKAGKGHLYEGGIRVPLIMHWDAGIKPGVDDSNIVLGMDIMPTIIDLATGQQVEGIDGKSYVPVLKGKESWKDRTVFWHSAKARPYSTGDSKCTAMRSGDYKLLQFFKDDRLELYNLKTDISEENNLYEQEPEVAKAMLTELKAWKKEYLVPEKMNLKEKKMKTNNEEEGKASSMDEKKAAKKAEKQAIKKAEKKAAKQALKQEGGMKE